MGFKYLYVAARKGLAENRLCLFIFIRQPGVEVDCGDKYLGLDSGL